jgi:hypothetical protein
MLSWSVLEAWTWFINVPYLGTLLLIDLALLTILALVAAGAMVYALFQQKWFQQKW